MKILVATSSRELLCAVVSDVGKISKPAARRPAGYLAKQQKMDGDSANDNEVQKVVNR